MKKGQATGAVPSYGRCRRRISYRLFHPIAMMISPQAATTSIFVAAFATAPPLYHPSRAIPLSESSPLSLDCRPPRDSRTSAFVGSGRDRTVGFRITRGNTDRIRGSSTRLPMSLIPIPRDELQSVLANRAPNGDQYSTYLGSTPRERFSSFFEGSAVAFIGTMFAYFFSFVVGQFLATLLGTVFLFWPILSPEFKAYQRNWELVGGRDLVDAWMDDEYDWTGVPKDRRGLYGAYYVARIVDASVVDDIRSPASEEYDLSEFQGYTMAGDELESVTGLSWKLRLMLEDDNGRVMQVHSRMSEKYLDIVSGMPVVGVLLSTSREFGELAAMTDFFVPDAGPAWVGDYPYLVKDELERRLIDNGIWDNMVWKEEEEEETGEDEEKLIYL